MEPVADVQIHVPDHLVDFGIGHPDPELLPLELVREATNEMLRKADRGLLQYGTEPGSRRFRAALSDFLSDGYGTATDPGTLFATSGVSQALDLLCNRFTRPGDSVFVEEPSYFLALRIFRDHGLRVRSIPTDEHGLRIDALEEALERETPRFVYTIPSFQNPTGVTLTADRRERLVALAAERGLLVLADEVYHLLDHGTPPPPAMASHASSGAVISLGSFSKILGPGIRLGWVQAAPSLLGSLADSGLLVSGGGLNPIGAAIVAELLRNGSQADHLTHLKSTYAERAAALHGALRSELPAGVRFRQPTGGYFAWLELPGQSAERLLTAAERHHVKFQPGGRFSSRDGAEHALRLCFAYYRPERLQEGAARLGRALADVA